MITKLICLLVITLCTFSCSENTHKKEVISEDLEVLKTMLKLDSIHPITVKWTHQTVGQGNSVGPTDSRITMVLSLNSKDWFFLKDKVEKNASSKVEMFLDESFVKSWFSENLKGCFFEKDGYFKISEKVYSADVFAKSPFLNGFCFFTKEREVLVYLYTT